MHLDKAAAAATGIYHRAIAAENLDSSTIALFLHDTHAR